MRIRTSHRRSLLIVAPLLATLVIAAPGDSSDGGVSPIPAWLNTHVTRVPVDTEFSGTRVLAKELYYAHPICALTPLPDGRILTESVIGYAGTNAKYWSDRALQRGYLDVSAKGRWTAGSAVPLFSEMDGNSLAYRLEPIQGTLLCYVRLRPGPPLGEDPVYRGADGFQSYKSVNRGFLRAATFLRPDKAGSRIEVVDGLGSRKAEYACTLLPDANCIEIETRHSENGFTSVWGVRDAAGGWKILSLVTGKRGRDGSGQASVTDLPEIPSSGDEGNALDTVYLSPHLAGTDSSTVYLWRSVTSGEKSEQDVRLFELCSWNGRGQPTVLDRYLRVKAQGRTQRYDWDIKGEEWRKTVLVYDAWADAYPAVCCLPSDGIVVSRADGVLRLFR